MVTKLAIRASSAPPRAVRVHVARPLQDDFYPPRDYAWRFERGARVCTHFGVYGLVVARAIHYSTHCGEGVHWYPEYLVARMDESGRDRREWLPEGDLADACDVRDRRAETIQRLLDHYAAKT